MFGWFLLAIVVVVLFWLASSRLHLTVSELIELALLTIVGVYVIADVAIYYMRRTAKRAEIEQKVLANLLRLNHARSR